MNLGLVDHPDLNWYMIPIALDWVCILVGPKMLYLNVFKDFVSILNLFKAVSS